MFKKRLIAGSVLLALLVLFALTGCSSPAGADGAQGPRGPERVEGAISPEQLAELFTIHDQIRVVTTDAGTTTIAGIVPAGKTLEITGVAGIANPGSLTINGTVHILKEGRLNANGTASGTIDRGSAGLLIVEGTLAADSTFFDHGIPSYVRIDRASPTATIVLANTGPDALSQIDKLFEYVPAIDTNLTTVLNPVSVAQLPNWEGAKKLITRGTQTYTSGTLDVSEKGQLVISGSLILGDDSGTTGATLKASDDGNVVVGPNGSIVLDYGSSSLVGVITINGGLTVADMTTPTPTTGEPERIPATVDLSGATITAANGMTLLLPTDEEGVKIKRINLTGAAFTVGLNGTGTTGGKLTVGSIANISGNASALTLPAIEVDTGSIVATDGVTIAGSAADTALSPASISGGALTLGANVVLKGPIDLDTTIALGSLANLGAAEAAFAQLANIHGGTVNAGALALPFVAGTYDTEIITTGAASFAGDTIFNYGLTIGGAVTTGTDTVSITLKDVASFGSTLNSSASLLTLNGPGRLTLTGALETGPIAVNNGNDGIVLQLAGGVTNTFKGLIKVGEKSRIASVAAAPGIVFGPGTYTPGAATGFTITTNGTTIALTVPGNLVLGEEEEGNLTFEDGPTVTAKSLVAGGTGVVTLSGKGYGAIIVESGSTFTQTFNRTGTEANEVPTIDLGKGGVIALAGTGSRFNPSGAIIRGFTFHKARYDVLTPQITTDVDQTSFRGNLLGKPYTGTVDITWASGATYKAVYDPADTGPFVYGELGTVVGTGTYFIAGTGGVLITRNSDIAE